MGGLTDISELKGHRRTYIGSMPGKVIQALKKTKSNNPLILIDEGMQVFFLVDKISKSHMGDPASALLEILDPEQNSSFLDHYLDIPVDLSNVLFVCTANITETIPPPLLDRMEVINISGYVSEEKMQIAKLHLIPTILKNNGISKENVRFTDSSLISLLKHYCRENGVRSLKKYLEKIIRKIAIGLVKNEYCDFTVDDLNLKIFCGQPIFVTDRLFDSQFLPSGIVTGLAWTASGGAILYVESIVEAAHTSTNSAKFTKTGQLGSVMQESSTIAYSFAKSFMLQHYPENSFFEHNSIHLHVPEGATPKDGPSAGSTMALSLISLACKKSIPSDMAMTGELTLSGKILRIGGVREKVVAAKRSGINNIIMPISNKADWEELPIHIRSDINAIFVETFDEIAKHASII